MCASSPLLGCRVFVLDYWAVCMYGLCVCLGCVCLGCVWAVGAQVLVGKTLEQALMEVHEDIELENIRARQVHWSGSTRSACHRAVHHPPTMWQGAGAAAPLFLLCSVLCPPLCSCLHLTLSDAWYLASLCVSLTSLRWILCALCCVFFDPTLRCWVLFQREFEQVRNEELAEVQRLEAEVRRKEAERVRATAPGLCACWAEHIELCMLGCVCST